MKIEIKQALEKIFIYYNNDKLGSVSYEVFMLKILSPKQLIQYEKNPDKVIWDVRKIDLNGALTLQEESIKYLY
jgi:hypothetical protein